MSGITRRRLLTLAGAAALFAVTGCAPGARAELTLGCGERGGSYLQFGQTLSRVMKRSGDLDVTALVTEGSVENLALLTAGRVDLALCLADTAASAGDGIVALGRVYQNYLQCIVRMSDGISRLDDLTGRAVSLGAPGSGVAATARRLLDAADMVGARAPVTSERPFRDALDDLERGGLDAIFWSGGVPTPQLAELSRRLPISLIDTTPALAGLAARYPGSYAETAIPAGVYDAPRAVPTIGIANLLLARSSLSDRSAAELVDVLIDDARDLVPPDALGVQYLTPASLIDTIPIPLHAAAENRYRTRYG